jgi:hypothetical protein
MNPTRLRHCAVATLAAAACTAGGGAASAAPTPITAEDLRLVTSQVSILAGDRVVERHSCEWTLPGPEDEPCLRFSGDPQPAIAAIRAAGGDRARILVTAPDIGLRGVMTIGRRANGQWLLRGDGEARGRRSSRGHLCSSDGASCVRWDAAGARSARPAVRAAAARLRAKR